MGGSVGVYITKYPLITTMSDRNQVFIKGKSGLDSFSISYNIEGEGVSVYGRQDPIQSYKSSGETMSLTFPLVMDVDYRDVAADIEKGTHAVTALDALNTWLERISKLCRPIYQGGAIKQSPLVLVVVGANEALLNSTGVETTAQFGGAPYIVAPTSLSIDFGDRARTISAFIQGGGTQSTNVAAKDAAMKLGAKGIVPSKVLITFSGAILYPDRRYLTIAASRGADDSNDTSANATKKKEAKTAAATANSGVDYFAPIPPSD